MLGYVCVRELRMQHTYYVYDESLESDRLMRNIHLLYMHLILCDCITQSDVPYAHIYVRAHARDYPCVCVAINV